MVKRYPDYDLSNRNTFRMRVRCALYVELTEEADLEALDWNALPQPVMVMGGGSNLLFTKDFPGTVLHYAEGAASWTSPLKAVPSAMSLYQREWSSMTSAHGRRRKAFGGRRICR